MEFDEHLDALRRSPVPPNTANMPIDEDILDIQAVEEAAMLAGDSGALPPIFTFCDIP